MNAQKSQSNPNPQKVVHATDAVRAGMSVPFSQEAEEALLGALLVNPRALANVRVFLKADDFYLLRHQHIYRALERLDDDPQLKVDYLTVQDELKSRGLLDLVGGSAYLTSLINTAPTSAHAEVYGRLIERAALRRQILVAADDMKALALNEELGIDAVVDACNQKLMEATRQRLEQYHETFADVLSRVYDQVEKVTNGEQTFGLQLGYRELETVNLLRGEVNYVVGLPKTGKTTFALNVAYNVAKAGGTVVYFSREMTSDDLTFSLIAMETGVPVSNLREGNLSPAQLKLFTAAVGKMSKYNLLIQDKLDRFSPLQIQRILRVLAREHQIALVVIDGFWLLEGDTDSRASTWEQTQNHSRQLLETAREFQLPLLVLHQFKFPEDRSQHPTMHDMAGGNTIPRDAHKIIGIYRDNHPDMRISRPGPAGQVQLKVLADRSTQTMGHIGYLRFVSGSSRYIDWEDDDHPAPRDLPDLNPDTADNWVSEKFG